MLFREISAILLFIWGIYFCHVSSVESVKYDKPVGPVPTVMVAVLVRNKAHVLPTFLYHLMDLDYPKDKITIWIRSDHNTDSSNDLLTIWEKKIKETESYQSVDIKSILEPKEFTDEEGPCHWSPNRFQHVSQLREEALKFAREKSIEYLFMLDSDVILTNRRVLANLISQKRTVVAPMLNTTASPFYSNFWGAMDESYYYKRSEDYIPILRRHQKGCFVVANVHSAVLINMKRRGASSLSYLPLDGYSGPLDDMIIFAYNALHYNVPLHILNKNFYGWFPTPLEAHNTLQQEISQFLHIKLENIAYHDPLLSLDYLTSPPYPATKFGFDNVYMINLKRRVDRFRKMQLSFHELELEFETVEAVDGKLLTEQYLVEHGITMLEGYLDPYTKRPLTMGEIGCFLSHYNIWQDMIAKGYDKVIVLEDDVRFSVYFKEKFQYMLQEAEWLQLDWDLIYLGRKKMDLDNEYMVPKSTHIAKVAYSYWTLGYILTLDGAKKLVNQDPLKKMIPVDEFLPVMFDQHPKSEYLEAFEPRDLKAFSAEPLLIYPTHYTGEPGYITDTESSEVVCDISKGDETCHTILGQQNQDVNVKEEL